MLVPARAPGFRSRVSSIGPMLASAALIACSRPTPPPAAPATDAASHAAIADLTPTPSPLPAPPTPRATGWTERLHLRHAPFAAHDEVLVHASPAFDPARPLRIVTFLHGWFGCVDVVASGTDAPCTAGGPVRYAMDVVAQFDRAGVDALLVLPQLAFDVASSSPGRLGDSGGFRDLIAEILADPAIVSHLGGPRQTRDIARTVLLAHSGAYVPAAFVVAHGGLDVHELHMLDALYHPRAEIDAWFTAHAADFGAATQPRRLTFIYTDREGTGPVTFATVDTLSRALDARAPGASWRVHRVLDTPPPDDLLASPLFVLRTAVTHEAIPRVFLAPVLDSSPALHDVPPR